MSFRRLDPPLATRLDNIQTCDRCAKDLQPIRKFPDGSSYVSDEWATVTVTLADPVLDEHGPTSRDFCSPACAVVFMADPANYFNRQQRRSGEAKDG